MKILDKNSGFSTLAALFTLLSLLAMGTAISYFTSINATSRANHLMGMQDFYIVQAGLEYSVKKIYEGQNGVVDPPGINFASGNFTVARDDRTLTVTGTLGPTVRSHQVESPTEADCNIIDVTNINLHEAGKRVSQVTFRKNCLASINVDKMQFTWTPDEGEKLQKIKIESLTAYNDPVGVPSGTIIDISNYIVTIPSNQVINIIEWDNSIEDQDITINFIMGDGTVKTATFTADD